MFDLRCNAQQEDQVLVSIELSGDFYAGFRGIFERGFLGGLLVVRGQHGIQVT
jgi:hypothetical protein